MEATSSAFRLSADPLDPAALQAALHCDASGGFVSFEGWVRDHNEGRAVLRLEYEAYAALAEAEGARILAEARERFPIDAAACVHRVGMLEIGGLAVWVGVASAHRAEAFAACRFIIDEIKHRVPIWKKEHYTEGDSGWVNCEACAHVHPAHAAPKLSEFDYYARQQILPEIGDDGQARLRAARVLVVGAGGLGCAALPYLAAAGVGTIGVCDADRVSASNLHRQVLYGVDDLGQPKASVAAARLRAQNPFITVEAVGTAIHAENAATLLESYSLVLDCSDNFETKFLLNDVCVALGKTLIQASLYQYEGQLFTIHTQADAPCLRCLWSSPPAAGCVGNCAEVGTLGTVAGTLGLLQAHEAVKLLLGLPGGLRGEMLLVDLLHHGLRRFRVPQQAECPTCAARHSDAKPEFPAPVAKEPLEISLSIDSPLPEGIAVIDLRDASEIAAQPLPWPAEAIATTEFEGGLGPIARDAAYLLVCTRGVRSRYLAMHLRAQGVRAACSLRGGAAALRP